MKIKECKNYFNDIVESFSGISKKKKLIATIFVILVGLLCFIPLVCIYINVFMQFLGIKWLIILSIISCGVILHILLSVMYPIYFIALNELNKDTCYIDNMSYKKLFIVLITDWFMIMFISIMIVVLVIIVNYLLF